MDHLFTQGIVFERLETIQLSSNQLTKIHLGMILRYLVEIKTLYVQDNQITTISDPSEVQVTRNSRMELIAHRNQFDCSAADLVWMMQPECAGYLYDIKDLQGKTRIFHENF